MTRPLALTLGEPAGIGPDITLAAWQRRAELGLPPFYLLADPDFLAERARLLGLDDSVPDRRAARGVRRLCGRAAGRSACREGDGKARPSGCIERAGRYRLDPPRGRRRVRRTRACRRHQSGRQGGALPHRLCRTRPYRIPRQAGAGAYRPRGPSGDDAVVARTRRRAGDHSSPGARRAGPAHHRI